MKLLNSTLGIGRFVESDGNRRQTRRRSASRGQVWVDADRRDGTDGTTEVEKLAEGGIPRHETDDDRAVLIAEHVAAALVNPELENVVLVNACSADGSVGFFGVRQLLEHYAAHGLARHGRVDALEPGLGQQ